MRRVSPADQYIRSEKAAREQQEQPEDCLYDSEHPIGQLNAFTRFGTAPFVWKLRDGEVDKSKNSFVINSPEGRALGEVRYRHLRDGFIELTHFVPALTSDCPQLELDKMRVELMWERMPK